MHYIADLYDRVRMRMLTHDNIEQKDREKLKYTANINIGEVGNTSLRQSGLVHVSIKVDHVAVVLFDIDIVNYMSSIYNLLKCSYLPYILCIATQIEQTTTHNTIGLVSIDFISVHHRKSC